MRKIITLFVFVLLCTVSYAQSWQNLASLPVSKICRAASFSIGTKGYVFVGSYTNTVYSYDVVTNTWATINPYPANTTDGVVGCSLNGIAYVGTGVQYSSRTNNFFSYNPATGNWTTLPNFPGTARAYAVMFVLDEKIYLGGGLNNPTSYNDFYVYDPALGAWNPTPIQPCPALGVSCDAVSFVIGDKAYVGSGGLINSMQQSIPQKDFWEYDTISKVWTRVADLPGSVRAEAVAFATCDKAFVGLGYIDEPRDSLVSDFWEYNPAKNKWNQIADYGGGQRNAAFAFTIGRTGYVCAGLSNSYNTYHDDLWSYTPTATPAFTTASFSTTHICAGQTVSFTDTSNFAPTNWQWTFPGGTPNTSAEQNPTIHYDTAGVYDVSLLAWNACDSGALTFPQYITVGQGDTLTVTANPTFVCSGQQATLTITSGSGAYQWSPATGLTDSTGSVIPVSPIATTTYTVQQTGGGACNSIGFVTVTVGNSTIGGTITAARDTICAGTTGRLTLSSNSSNTIQWMSSTDSIDFADIVGAIDTVNYRTDPLLQSTWYIAAVGSGSCISYSDTLQLVVPPSLTASFESTAVDKVVTFDASSSLGNIRVYFWDFGDGVTSADANPTHTYAKDTLYNVCLTIYDGSNCSYTFCRNVDLTVGVASVNAAGTFNIYPNPFGNELNIEPQTLSSHVQSIEMYDVLGRVMVSQVTGNNNSSAFHINTSTLASGMYYLTIKTAAANYVQKVIKQ